MSKLYHFRQNNSGGRFVTDDARGLGPHVWVEANSAKQANALAQALDIYFDGSVEGRDCSCCGDRWHESYDDDEGEATLPPFDAYTFHWHHTVYVHRLDGTIERHKESD